jgi:hypothetical protein
MSTPIGEIRPALYSVSGNPTAVRSTGRPPAAGTSAVAPRTQGWRSPPSARFDDFSSPIVERREAQLVPSASSLA